VKVYGILSSPVFLAYEDAQISPSGLEVGRIFLEQSGFGPFHRGAGERVERVKRRWRQIHQSLHT